MQSRHSIPLLFFLLFLNACSPPVDPEDLQNHVWVLVEGELLDPGDRFAFSNLVFESGEQPEMVFGTFSTCYKCTGNTLYYESPEATVENPEWVPWAEILEVTPETLRILKLGDGLRPLKKGQEFTFVDDAAFHDPDFQYEKISFSIGGHAPLAPFWDISVNSKGKLAVNYNLDINPERWGRVSQPWMDSLNFSLARARLSELPKQFEVNGHDMGIEGLWVKDSRGKIYTLLGLSEDFPYRVQWVVDKLRRKAFWKMPELPNESDSLEFPSRKIVGRDFPHFEFEVPVPAE